MAKTDPPKKSQTQPAAPAPKPSTSTIKDLLGKAKYALPGIGPALAATDVISKFSLGRMSENLDPYDYSTAGAYQGKSAVGRFIDAVVLNKKEPEREETERYVKTGYGKIPYTGFKERVDLLQMLAGKNQKYGTIQESQFRPTIGDVEKDKKFYSSKSLESQIQKELDLPNKEIRSQKDVVDMITAIASIDPETNKPMIGKGGVVTTIPGLGQATYGVGRDEKGIYLSYGDVWDLDPSSGLSADIKKGGLTSLAGLSNLAVKAGKKIASSVVNAAAKPTSVYGRIYFDPKTGKPIQ